MFAGIGWIRVGLNYHGWVLVVGHCAALTILPKIAAMYISCLVIRRFREIWPLDSVELVSIL